MTKPGFQRSKGQKPDTKLFKNKARDKRKAKKRKERKAFRRYKKRYLEQKLLIQKNISFHFPTIMSGDCYWKNYMNVCNWQRNYYKYVQNKDFLPAISGQEMYPTFGQREKPRKMSSNGNCSAGNSVKSSQFKETSNFDGDIFDDDEYIVTEEMMKFLEISIRHKEEMKQKKEINKIKNKQKSVPERDDIEECLAPQEKTIDAKRSEEMSELYGDSVAMIMGMETALQLAFNRNCDIYKPTYWPILPFKLKFS